VSKYRKPISAVITDYGWLVVICDDGSLWYRLTLTREDTWEPLTPPIPGTAAEDADEIEFPAPAGMAASRA